MIVILKIDFAKTFIAQISKYTILNLWSDIIYAILAHYFWQISSNQMRQIFEEKKHFEQVL